LANAFAGGVIDRVGDGRRGADIGQLAETFERRPAANAPSMRGTPDFAGARMDADLDTFGPSRTSPSRRAERALFSVPAASLRAYIRAY
jgi:hypothetical protein